MKKQNNSAKRNETNTNFKKEEGSVPKKIDEYFFANKKRSREEDKQEELNSNPINTESFFSNQNSEFKENIKPQKPSEQVDLTLNEESYKQNSSSPKKKKKQNNNICSICRDFGDLLLCDKCPKSFHPNCLKIKASNIKSEGEWFCPACLPKVEKVKKRNEETDERKKLRNEKKKLWRLKRKEQIKKISIESITYKQIPLISDDFINRLNQEKKRFENKTFFSSDLNTISQKHKSKKLKSKALFEKNSKNNSSKHFMKDFLEKGKNKSIPNKEENNAKEINKNNSFYSSSSDSESAEDLIQMNNNNQNNFSLNNFSKQKVSRIQIKYPVDDFDLYANPDKYNLADSFFKKPKGKSSLIPDAYFTKIIKIWDVIDSFKSKFVLSKQISPEELFVALNYYGIKPIEILNEIHVSFLKIFYDEIKLKLVVEFANDPLLLMFKIAFENSSNNKLNFCWLECVKIIIQSSYFSLMVDEEVYSVGKKLNLFKYNWQYNLLPVEEKILILEFFCNSAMDTYPVRELVRSEIEKKKELKSEVNNLELELKIMDSRKKELERQEKFTQPKVKIETITKRLENLVEENPNISRMELMKLRKELEQEREQFKSVLKEADNLEINRGKLVSKIEKIELDLFNLGSIHKKIIGIDGLKNEYFFHNNIPNKILVKRPQKNKKHFKWSELSSEEDIDSLLSSLSEKGTRELNLTNKIKKLLNKKLKLIKEELPVKSESEMLKELIGNDIKSEIAEEEINRLETKNLSENFDNLENQISDYLNQDRKEWEDFVTKMDLKAFVNASNEENEIAKCFILLNERFKNPFKMNETKSNMSNKVIADEEEYGKGGYVTSDMKIDLNYFDENKLMASKTKVWSTDYIDINLEGNYINYLENLKSFKSLNFACLFYLGISSDLFKRRDVYKHYKKKEIDIPEPNQKGLNSTNESKKDQNNFNSKKMIVDDLDEFYYDEEQFEIHNRISRDRNNINTRRSVRQRDNINYREINLNNKPNEPNINWNSECFICEDGGNLILCEKCPNAAHLDCINLTKEPDFWTCENCLNKLVNRRITRSNKI